MTDLFRHQVEGIAELSRDDHPETGRTIPRAMWLGDDPGAGKTLQVIRAAEALWSLGRIDHVLVVAPNAVCGVWADPEFGQVAQYAEVPIEVSTYRSGKNVTWRKSIVEAGGNGRSSAPDRGDRPPLRWTVTNYELVRRSARLSELLRRVDLLTLLVLDESLNVKSPTSLQTRACYDLRQACGRVITINGSPEGDNPGDAYAQLKILDERILGCRNWYEFRARYAKMGGYARLQKVKVGGVWKVKRVPVQIVGWVNLDDLRRRMEPYVLRRSKRDFMDLPPVLDPMTITVPLAPETWRLYKAMREEAVVWLDENASCSATSAAVRVLRLAQLTAGFLGGVSEDLESSEMTTREIGREKLDAVLDWIRGRYAEDPELRAVLWCRFRPELERLARSLAGDPDLHKVRIGAVHGSQDREERRAALALLDPKTAAGPALVASNIRTGGVGLDMHAAHLGVYLTNDFSLILRRQSEGRLDRTGQVAPVQFVDVVATGPEGQKTVDHTVIKALRKKENVAEWTAGEWSRALREDDDGA